MEDAVYRVYGTVNTMNSSYVTSTVSANHLPEVYSPRRDEAETKSTEACEALEVAGISVYPRE